MLHGKVCEYVSSANLIIVYEIFCLHVYELQVPSNARHRQYLQYKMLKKASSVHLLFFLGRSDVSHVLEVISHKKRFVFIYASNMLERVLRLAEDLLCVHI